MLERRPLTQAKARYMRLCHRSGLKAFLCRTRTTTMAVALAAVALTGIFVSQIPAPAVAPSRTGEVYMVSISGKVRLGEFVGAPRNENGVSIWRDKKGSEYRTAAPVIFETR